jgi:hypothetical protein
MGPLSLAGLLVVYYVEVIFGGALVSAADLVYSLFLPWAAAPPPGFEPSNTALADSVVSFAPAMSYVRESLAMGQLPLWNPYTEFGLPFFAQSQWGLLSPVQIPLLAFPTRYSVETAQTLTGMLKIAVAGAGAFLLARRLRCSRSSAGVAAIAYMFGGYTTVWLSMPATSVTAFLPWICLGVEWVLMGRRVWLGAAGLAAALAAAVLGGHPEIVLFTVTGAVMYAAVRVLLERRALRGELAVRATALATGSILALGICAIVLLPATELFVRSVDSGIRAANYADSFLPWSRLLHVVDVNHGGSPIEGKPEIGHFFSSWAAPWYVGVTAALLVPVAIVRRDRRLVPFAAVALATITVVMNLWPYRVLIDVIPSLGGVYKPNALALWSFALAMASGLGADGFQRFVAGRAQRPWLVPAVGIALCATLFAELYSWGHDYNPRVPRSRVAVPPPPELAATPPGKGAPRTVVLGNALRAQLPTLFRRGDIRGYGQPTRRDYDRFFKAVVVNYPPGFYATDAAYKINDLRPNAARVLESAGMTHVAWSDGEWRLRGFDRVRTGTLNVARGRGDGNRAYVVYDYEVIGEDAAAVRRVGSRSFDPKRGVVLAHAPEGVAQGRSRGDASPRGKPTSPRVTRYENNEIVVEVAMLRPGVLVLTDSIYPGWTATVDGRDAQVIRANGLFRAVGVPAGRHVVRFRYQPASITVGAGISLLSVLATIGLALFDLRRRPSAAGGRGALEGSSEAAT